MAPIDAGFMEKYASFDDLNQRPVFVLTAPVRKCASLSSLPGEPVVLPGLLRLQCITVPALSSAFPPVHTVSGRSSSVLRTAVHKLLGAGIRTLWKTLQY